MVGEDSGGSAGEAAPGPVATDPARPARSGPPTIARVVLLSAVGAVSVVLLFVVAPPGRVLGQIGAMNLDWVLVALALEVGSCLCYPIVFRRFFPEPPRAVARRIAWMAMGAGAVLPGGNISSAAATGLLLRRHGINARQLLERCGSLLLLLTLFGFFVNLTAGVLLLLGVPGGPHDLLHTGGPILVSVGVLGSATALMLVARRLGDRGWLALRGIAVGLEHAWDMVRTAHWRLVGAAGFLLLDMGALWAACQATGHPIGVPALVIAYCIGYLATVIPMPAGLGVLDSGLSASLVLYGMRPSAASVGAVLVYHAISIWVPACGGLIAWAPLRRSGRASHPPVVIAAGPLRIVEVTETET